MAPPESLNASQRAVLQLLLRQGKSYAELAGLLNLDAPAARVRAHGAVAALAPPPDDLSAERVAELTDHLLGQETEAERSAARSLLEGSAPARTWARGAADALRPLASRPLPEIPSEPGAKPRSEASDAAPRAEAATTTPEPEQGAASGPASGPTPEPDPGAEPGAVPADRARRLSPTGMRLLLGGLATVAAIAIAIAIVLATTGEGDRTADGTTTPTTTSAAAPGQPSAVIILQADLRSPPGGIDGARGEAGIVRLRDARRYRFAVQARGLPATSSRSAAYGVWLYTDAQRSQFLGLADAVVGRDGRLDAVRDLSPDTPTFSEVLLTREVSPSPERPGPVVLRGPLVTAASAAPDDRRRTTTTP